jgi:trigger factor
MSKAKVSPMQVTETHADPLKREFRIVIGAADLDSRLNSQLETMKDQVRVKGFRPGKVPVSYLKKAYGKSIMGEVVQQAVAESARAAISERSLRPAMEPSIELESALESVLDQGADLAFKMAVELLPEITVMDLKSIALERVTAPVEDSEVEDALKRLAEEGKNYEAKPEGGVAANGDALTIDFLGKIDGVPFEGGKGEEVRLVLGQGRFIPGFEEQLLGAKAGEDRVVTITFPADYPAENLKGKTARFDVKIHEVRAPQETVLDDPFAQRFGIESLDKLKDALKDQVAGRYKQASRVKLKRALLDVLDAAHDFALPAGLVSMEFDQIWKQVEHAREHGHPEPDDVGKSEEELRETYRKIAERRVRLGLVLAEVGRLNNIQVGQDEVARLMGEEARRYPGQEQRVFDYYRQNPAALTQLRAPLFEEKVVDFIVELAKVTDKTVTKDELLADLDEGGPDGDHDHDHDHAHDHGEEGHVHGPDCDHDH